MGITIKPKKRDRFAFELAMPLHCLTIFAFGQKYARKPFAPQKARALREPVSRANKMNKG
ncbi:MAG: hypothetical protein IKB51_01300 [Clostridia bacterium]|nr:hypothetical protein [Clostridia bacterium]